MKTLVQLDFICFPLVLLFLMIMRRKGTLNEKRWGIILVSYFNITAVTLAIDDFISSNGVHPFSWLGIAIISLVLWVFVYPISRLIYREMFDSKK